MITKRKFYKPQCDEPLLIINRSSLNAIYHGAQLYCGDSPSSLITQKNVFTFHYKAVFQSVESKVEEYYLVKDGKFYDYLMIYVPCGKCPQCRHKKQIDLINRCQLESLCYKVPPYFVTLTYDDAHLPYHSELCYEDIQKFFKRWRRRLDKRGITHNIRYLVAGEYGSKSKLHRPHYHLIIWNNPYNACELTPAAHKKFARDVFESWGNCQLSGFDFGECKGGAAPYATKYVSKGSRSYGRWTAPFIHSSIGSGGLGFPYLKKVKEYYQRNPHLRSLSYRDLTGTVKEIPFGSYLTQHLFPSPVRQVPGVVKLYYRQLTDILFHLYCCGFLSYNDIVDYSELLRPYKSVIVPRIPSMKFESINVPGCSTYKQFYLFSFLKKLDYLSFRLAEVNDISRDSIINFDFFKSLQPDLQTSDTGLSRFRRLRLAGDVLAKEVL